MDQHWFFALIGYFIGWVASALFLRRVHPGFWGELLKKNQVAYFFGLQLASIVVYLLFAYMLHTAGRFSLAAGIAVVGAFSVFSWLFTMATNVCVEERLRKR